MEIEISQEILENIERASKNMGLNEKEIVARAIKLYLASIKDQLLLKEELEVWERASMDDNKF